MTLILINLFIFLPQSHRYTKFHKGFGVIWSLGDLVAFYYFLNDLTTTSNYSHYLF
jgi:hypothetical protein